MNIDVLNKQVAAKLGIKEARVKLLNEFYWRQVYDHLYTYTAAPVNIESICVLYPHAYFIKKQIHFYIKRLKGIHKSTKFNNGSIKQLSYINNYENYLRKFLKLRKESKFTN